MSPVVVLVLPALGAFVYGVVFVDSVRLVVTSPWPVGDQIGRLLIVIDLFLVGATLLIAAIRLYELLVRRVDVAGPRPHALPAWLEIRDLNDLKAHVLAMIVLATAVSFVEVLVGGGGGREVLELGAGGALMIGAITAFLAFGGQGRGGG
jgi:uncharacterized membrane protein YqhA